MANLDIVQPYPGTEEKVIDTSAVIKLGGADDNTVAQWVVQAVMVGGTISFTPKQTVTGSALTGANLIACVYYTNASETAIAAGAASTTSGIYYIPSDGVETHLDFTISGGGVATLYIRKVQG